MSSAPVGVQSTLISSLGEFLGYWAGWYPGLPPVLVSIAFPFSFHISVFFHSLFFTCHRISFVFLLSARRICINPMLWSQRRNRGVHGAEISIQKFNFFPGRGRTSDLGSGVTT